MTLAASSIPGQDVACDSLDQRLEPWKFWLPTLLVGLVVIVSDFSSRYALEASGQQVDTDLVASVGGTNAARQLAFAALGMGGAMLFLGRCFKSLAHPRTLMMIVAVFAYAAVSTLWSDAPETTIRRVAILWLVLLAAAGIGRTWQPMHLVHMTMLLSVAFAVSGLAAELRYGSLWPNAEYRFAGLLHPNRQALNCGLLALAAVAMQAHTGHKRYWLLAGIAFGLLLMTGSRGGTIASLAALVFYWAASASTHKRVGLILSCGFLIGVGLLLLATRRDATQSLENLAMMGRVDPLASPTTLTGRIPIWLQMLDDIRLRPILGYGYGAFWTPERVHRLSYIHDWEFSNAHSIYLESLLNLGAVGFSLGLLTIATLFAKGLAIYRRSLSSGILFILAVMVMAAVSGLAEAIFVGVGYETLLVLIGALLIVYDDGLIGEGQSA
jgi:exopolysaccharide production protein ExoQ